jgi:hypothetical protein
MSVVQRILAKIESGLITFINMVTLANRDYPYHDYIAFTPQSTKFAYVVGQNQTVGHGDQRKLFVSKSTLIYSTEDQTIHLNNMNNVAIVILASTWYEFKSNIYQVFVTTPAASQYIKFYFEGVLPQEARNPE